MLSISVFAILAAILLIYTSIVFIENKRLKKHFELMQKQETIIKRLVKQNEIKLDNQSIKEADYSMDKKKGKILLYRSEAKNMLDFSIDIDENNNIKYWGEYKP